MKKTRNYLACALSGIVFSMSMYAQNNNSNTDALMTARDVQNNTLSNVSIVNQAGQTITIAGLFIASHDTGDDCSVCFGGVIGGDNAGGLVASPVTIQSAQALPIGQNFLYNMLYNSIFYIKANGHSPCSLPGCSWPGDTADTHWCLGINAASINSNYTYSHYTNGAHPPASILAYAASGNSPASQFNYKYDLIDPNTLGVGSSCIGPVVCDDKTLTCRVSKAQSESLQPY